MVTNAGLVIRPVVGLLFLLAGILLLRSSSSRTGAWMITVGALLLLGSELYGVFTLRPFVGRNYDEAWYEQIAKVDALPTLGLLVCAVGLVGLSWSRRAGRYAWRACKALTVGAVEQGTVERPKQAAMQRVCALRGPAESARIAR